MWSGGGRRRKTPSGTFHFLALPCSVTMDQRGRSESRSTLRPPRDEAAQPLGPAPGSDDRAGHRHGFQKQRGVSNASAFGPLLTGTLPRPECRRLGFLKPSEQMPDHWHVENTHTGVSLWKQKQLQACHVTPPLCPRVLWSRTLSLVTLMGRPRHSWSYAQLPSPPLPLLAFHTPHPSLSPTASFPAAPSSSLLLGTRIRIRDELSALCLFVKTPTNGNTNYSRKARA